MEVKRVRVLSGPNIWAYFPVLEIWLDIGAFEQQPSNEIPGFTERLAAAIPSLWSHRCSKGRPGGFFERLRRGTYMGHIVEHIILELQTLAGLEGGPARAEGAATDGAALVLLRWTMDGNIALPGLAPCGGRPDYGRLGPAGSRYAPESDVPASVP